jgi:hypothetical protein
MYYAEFIQNSEDQPPRRKTELEQLQTLPLATTLVQ